jgi:putative transposase
MNIEQSCGLLGYTKQAYYKSLQHHESKAFDEYLILELIHQKRKIWKKGSGRNLLASLKDDFSQHDIKIGRDKFFDLLRAHNLLIKRKSRRAVTTNSYHHFHRYRNLILGLIPDKPNHIWVSDITYVWVQQEACFLYLFLITDMYSRKIIGYSLRENLKAKGAIEAIKMAIKQTQGMPLTQTIHHSDRSIQYCSNTYTNLLKKYSINISMTENSDPLENAIAERVNRTIKEEFMDNYKSGYESIGIATHEIKRNIAFYNEIRPHRSIEMLTPNQAHKRTGRLERKWKNYYKNKTPKLVN